MPRKQGGAAAPLSLEIKAQLAQSLEPIRKDAVEVYRGNERRAILSISSPASGRFSSHALRLVGDCCKKRKQESRHPQALRALKGTVPGYIVMEPVQVYDATAPDQYQIKWYKGNKIAVVELLPILQPRNLEVPEGYVSEMPVSVEELPNAGTYILIHSGEASVRPAGDAESDDEETAPAAGDTGKEK